MYVREQVPPGWKRRLYGRQDACRYGAWPRGGDGLGYQGKSSLIKPTMKNLPSAICHLPSGYQP